MPLLRINAAPDGPELHRSVHPLHFALLRHAQDFGPVIIMIHGYKFRPGDPGGCPHDHIFALDNIANCPRAISWPRLLGMDACEGLGIAFGWNGGGTLWQARVSALRAGEALGGLVQRLRRIAPQRPVHVIAHSLGAQVAFSALTRVGAGDIHRIVVLNGAAYQSQAHAALASAAGKKAELFNVTTRENAVFDFAFERLILPGGPGDRALGKGFRAGNAVTLRIDDTDLLHRLARHGIRVANPERRVCHWSTYLRPGVFELYRNLLHDPQRLPMGLLQQITEAIAPRKRPRHLLALLPAAKRAS